MEFLTPKDLESQIFDDFIDDSTEGERDILDVIETNNIALVKSKLRQRFNVTAIFSAVGDNRNGVIIKVLVCLVLYDMIRRNAARKIPSDAKDDYKWALAWLNDVRDGKEKPDLPLLETTEFKEVYHGNNTNEDLYL